MPCPPGGSGGLGPPGISVNYPCLASAAAVPCPRALPPIFFRPKFFRPNFFRPMFFRPSSVRRPSSVVRKIFSAMYCLSNLFRSSITKIFPKPLQSVQSRDQIESSGQQMHPKVPKDANERPKSVQEAPNKGRTVTERSSKDGLERPKPFPSRAQDPPQIHFHAIFWPLLWFTFIN